MDSLKIFVSDIVGDEPKVKKIKKPTFIVRIFEVLRSIEVEFKLLSRPPTVEDYMRFIDAF